MVTFVTTKLPVDFVTMACASQKTRLSRLKNDFSSPSRNCTHMYHRTLVARRRRTRLNAQTVYEDTAGGSGPAAGAVPSRGRRRGGRAAAAAAARDSGGASGRGGARGRGAAARGQGSGQGPDTVHAVQY